MWLHFATMMPGGRPALGTGLSRPVLDAGCKASRLFPREAGPLQKRDRLSPLNGITPCLFQFARRGAAVRGGAADAVGRDTASDARELLIALLVGALALGLPHGFAVAMIVGAAVYHAARRYNLLAEQTMPVENNLADNTESPSPTTPTAAAASRL